MSDKKRLGREAYGGVEGEQYSPYVEHHETMREFTLRAVIVGILVGVLTIIVRLTNPAYFEGVVFAILLASMFAPLCDYFVVERNIRRRRRRLEGG